MMLQPQTKSHNLHDPIAACGDRVYSISSQNGLFPDSWGGHVPHEMWGVWDHPIKLLDGFWFGVSEHENDPPRWLSEASECRAYAGYNEFDYPLGPLTVTRRDCAPDGIEGMIVTLTIRARQSHPRPITLHALFRSDLRPAWLGEEAGMVDGKDSAVIRAPSAQPIAVTEADEAHYDPTTLRDAPLQTPGQPVNANSICVFTDAANSWTCIVGADQPPIEMATGNDLWAINRNHGVGTAAQFKYALQPLAPLLSGEGLGAVGSEVRITFYIAGSATSQAEATATYWTLAARHAELANQKIALYESIARTSELITPDARLNAAAAWSKLITQMFVREVPKYGRGVSAGLPEYPWWFGIDTAYAALPMLQSGQFELVRDTLRLLKAQSEHHNPDEPGRVLHEMSSTGVVFNKGNMVEVPTLIRAVHQYFLWSGDRAFLDEMYAFCKAGLLDYALGQCDADGDLCPSGRSIIETLEMHAGFEVIDVAAYTWEALTRLADMATVVGDDAIVPDLKHKADALAERIRADWWVESEGLFADARASANEVEGALRGLEQQAREQGWLLEQQKYVETTRALFDPLLAQHGEGPRDADLPWLLRHWVVMCPVEVGLATPEQAQRVLGRLGSEEFSNEWGMYLHPWRHDVMSINTGLLALAAARYGHVDDALSIVNKLTRAFGYRTPGAVCEALPDGWCFLQLWSNVGLVSPAVECFLGIQPRAHERVLHVKPNLPPAWQWAEVRQLRVGDACFDIRVERDGAGYAIDVRGDEGWRIER